MPFLVIAALCYEAYGRNGQLWVCVDGEPLGGSTHHSVCDDHMIYLLI